MTEYAHIQTKDNAIVAIYINTEEDSGPELLGAGPAGSTNTTIAHLNTTFTYEVVSGNIVPVTQQDIYDRMNDPDDTTVVIPSE
jgi:hypothetical protein